MFWKTICMTFYNYRDLFLNNVFSSEPCYYFLFFSLDLRILENGLRLESCRIESSWRNNPSHASVITKFTLQASFVSDKERIEFSSLEAGLAGLPAALAGMEAFNVSLLLKNQKREKIKINLNQINVFRVYFVI